MIVANQDRISRTADGGVAYRPGYLAEKYVSVIQAAVLPVGKAVCM